MVYHSYHLLKKDSAILCAFKKGHSTQHALFRVVEMVRRCIDKGGVTAMVLMDLLNAYDSLPHDLLFAKLDAYGVGIDSLKLALVPGSLCQKDFHRDLYLVPYCSTYL